LFEIRLLRAAIAFLEQLNEVEQREVLERLSLLSQDPSHDGVHKFPFLVPPVTVSLYDDGQFKIVYHVVNERLIRVWAIGRSEEALRLQ
jgi:hypothetical protein